MYDGITKYKTDLAVGLCRRKGDGWITEPNRFTFTGKKLIDDDILIGNDDICHWLYIYKATILSNVRYDESINISEDWLFVKEAIINSKSIAYIDSPGYLYWDNGVPSLAWNKSFDYDMNLNIIKSHVYAHLRFYNKLRKNDLEGQRVLIESFNTSCIYFYGCYKGNCLKNKNDINRVNEMLKPYLSLIRGYTKIKYILYLHFPILTFRIMKLFHI